MTLIVEDGTGLANAESYASVAAAEARLAAFGNTVWATGTQAVKEADLRNATAYMVQTYRGRWKGSRMSGTQALDWPRSDVYADGFEVADNIVPFDVVNTTIDLAARARSGPLNEDISGQVVIREKVGPLETEYAESSTNSTWYRAVDQSLASLLTGGAFQFGVMRA